MHCRTKFKAELLEKQAVARNSFQKSVVANHFVRNAAGEACKSLPPVARERVGTPDGLNCESGSCDVYDKNQLHCIRAVTFRVFQT